MVWFPVKCLKQGIKNRNSVLKRVGKSAIFCLKHGQGMRGVAAPPHPRIYRVPPPPPRRLRHLYDELLGKIMSICPKYKVKNLFSRPENFIHSS